jgi:hypothetical protein
MLTHALEKPFAMRGKWSIGGTLVASVMLMKYLSANLATYALGSTVILKVLYELSKTFGPGSRLARASILLGRYSWFATLLKSFFMPRCPGSSRRPRWELAYETIFVVVATVVFSLLLSVGLAVLCDRYRFAAKTYKLIFRRARFAWRGHLSYIRAAVPLQREAEPAAVVSWRRAVLYFDCDRQLNWAETQALDRIS